MYRATEIYQPTKGYRPTFSEALSDLEQHGSLEKWFVKNPLAHWAENYPEMLHEFSSATGVKLRASVASAEQMVELSYLLPWLADLAVFSPALAWPTCDLANTQQCCEFADAHNGLESIYISGRITELLAWLIEARPLVERGLLAYLPLCGNTPHRWNCREMQPSYSDSESLREARALGSVPSAALAFWEDLTVSARLHCLHLLPWFDSRFVAVCGMPSLSDTGAKEDRPFLRVKIPYTRQLTLEQLASLLDSVHEALQRFHSAIDNARQQAAETSSNAEQPSHTRQIELDVIEPARHDLWQAIQANGQTVLKPDSFRWTEVLIEAGICEASTKPALLELPVVLALLTDLGERLARCVEVPENSILEMVGRYKAGI